MIFCILFDMSTNPAYRIYVVENYYVLIVKFTVTCTLHLIMYPGIAKGINLQKFVVNHPEKFERPFLAFIITYINFSVELFSIIANISLIMYKQTIESVIVHVVALHIINHLPHLYREALFSDKLIEGVFENLHHLHVHNKSSEIAFKERKFDNKIARLIYKLNRMYYASFIFYWLPLASITFYF